MLVYNVWLWEETHHELNLPSLIRKLCGVSYNNNILNKIPTYKKKEMIW